MIRRLILGCAVILFVGTGYLEAWRQNSTTPAGQAAVPSTFSSQRPLLDKYCAGCHSQKSATAGLVLENADLTRVGDNAAVFERVLRKLKARSMPPAGMLRPDEPTYQAFISWLEGALDGAAAAHPNPGRLTIHRLNRLEYANAIRDLLALEIDGRALLPADDLGYGFDNIADILTFSPGLLERYMSAATEISRLAVGDPAIRPVAQTYTVPKFLLQDDRASEDLPFTSRGGMAITHQFPLDAEYEIKIRLQRAYGDVIRGLAQPHQLEVRLNGRVVKSFTVGGRFTDSASITRQRAQAARDHEQADQLKIQDEKRDYQKNADDQLFVRIPVKAGPGVVGVAFLNENTAYEGVLRPRVPVTGWSYLSCGAGWSSDLCDKPSIDTVQIVGPFNGRQPEDTASRRKIFVCHPAGATDQKSCAKTTLSAFARRAYRRPVNDQDVEELMNLYNTGHAATGFDGGIELALRGLLVSPNFLFRIERDPANVRPGTPYRLTDLEFASRLSFFLWSSIPDDELLGLAERGHLKDSHILEQQVRRMLRDSRSKSLVNNFFGQWLFLRNVSAITPDSVAFPEFDDSLREAFERETELFLQNQLGEDRSVLDLLRANYTFVNQRLAEHYSIPNVYGTHFRRVTLPDDRRAGLLGQGSILMVTSYVNRTSPVVRGKWLLDNILGTPPPPPPPNVPVLPEKGENGKAQSVRERIEQHRKASVCASCHSIMDPLGFALENFDGIGKWRTTGEAGTPIDSSGSLPDGTRINGPADLRKALLGRKEEFVRTVSEKLLTYALGRGIEYYDAPAIRKIMREAASNDYRWSSLITGIVRSMPFQMRVSREPDSETKPAARPLSKRPPIHGGHRP